MRKTYTLIIFWSIALKQTKAGPRSSGTLFLVVNKNINVIVVENCGWEKIDLLTPGFVQSLIKKNSLQYIYNNTTNRLIITEKYYIFFQMTFAKQC